MADRGTLPDMSDSSSIPRAAGLPDWPREAEARLARGDPAGAEQVCSAWLDARPGDPQALLMAAHAALAQGRAGDALSRLTHALRAAPARADLHAQRARVLSLAGRTADALAAVDVALACPPFDAATLDTLGVVLSRAQAHERASALFKQAIALAPQAAGIRYNLASSLKFLGHFDDAEAAYEACIASDPRYWKAHSGLAQLRTATAARNHLARLEALLPAAANDPHGVIHLRQALAKECEDLRQPQPALRHWHAAKQAKRRLQPYDFTEDGAVFAALERLFATAPDAVAGHHSREPIFVTGMPRTGTTLVDRILSSHPDVQSAGELLNFAHLLKRAAGTPGRHALDVPTLERGLTIDAAALGRAYVDSTRPQTGQRRHFIDKMPLNLLYAGHIHRALPQARIICLLRHPLDTVLSNFRQLFSIDNPYYRYADDLMDCARYVLAFRRLVRLWQTQLGAAFHVVDYETLVTDPEPTIRVLLEHCQIEWNARCLAFEHNPAPVSTASSVQVRAPLNARAIGRWREHAEALAPARALFEASGIACE